MCLSRFLARLIACRSPTLQSKQREKKWKITVMAFGRGASERYHRFTASCGVIKWTPPSSHATHPNECRLLWFRTLLFFFIRQSQFASAKVCAVYAFVFLQATAIFNYTSRSCWCTQNNSLSRICIHCWYRWPIILCDRRRRLDAVVREKNVNWRILSLERAAADDEKLPTNSSESLINSFTFHFEQQHVDRGGRP